MLSMVMRLGSINCCGIMLMRTFYLALDEKCRFKKCYVSLDACKRGFLHGCRPLIFLDGCNIKTRYRGKFLTVVGMDPTDCIYPIAFGVLEVEDT